MALQFADGTQLTLFDPKTLQYVSRYTDGDRRDVLRPCKYQVDHSCLFTITNVGSNSFVLRADNGHYLRRHTITREIWGGFVYYAETLVVNALAAVEGDINAADRFSFVEGDGAQAALRISDGPPVWMDSRQKKGDALPWIGEIQVTNSNYLFLFASASSAEPAQFKIEAPTFSLEVPGGARTDAAPCAVTLGNSLYLIHKGGDSRIYLAKFDDSTWSQWYEVPGGAVVNTALTATVIGSTLYLATKGTGHDLYFTTSDGSNWSGWRLIAEGDQTDVAPSISSDGTTPYLFYKGLDRGIYFRRYTSEKWGESQSFAGGTNVSPTAVLLHSELQLYHTGMDKRVYYTVLRGSSWDSWHSYTGDTTLPCALADSPNQGAFALTGTDSLVYLSTGTVSNWTGLYPVTGQLKTNYAPALAYLGSKCYLFYTGQDQKLYYSIIN